MGKRNKIALIGAGNIGGTLAHISLSRQLGDVVLFDIMDGIAKGKALDLAQASPLSNSDCTIIGTSSYTEIQDADVVIVTAGIPRKPGMSRDDLVATNAKVIQEVGKNIKKYSPNAFVIVVTNPVDVMSWVMYQATGFNMTKVVGMAGILDTVRFRHFLGAELGVSAVDVKTFVLGGHGDTMVPLQRYTTIGGVPIDEFIKSNKISQQRLDEIIHRTQVGGGEIVELLKTGSAFYAPAESAIRMAEAYLYDRRIIECCSIYDEKHDVYVGKPVLIGGQKGMEEKFDLDLTENEQEMLSVSIEKLIDSTAFAKKLLSGEE